MGIRKTCISLLSLLFLLSFLSKISVAFGNALITSTQYIRDGQTIISQNGTVELGFFSSDDLQNRFVGIWFVKVSVKTVIWVANRKTPLNDSSGVLKMGNDGNLVILDGKQNIIWSSNVSFSSNNSVAELLDSGDLVLRDLDNKILWECFNLPSDTFLPGMKFGVNFRTGDQSLLTSWRTIGDPSLGNYTLGFDPRGVAQIITWDFSGNRYWRSGQWNGQLLTGVPEMTSFSLYGFNIINDKEEGRVYCIYSNNNASIFSRFILSSAGKLERSYWNPAAQAWDIVWSQPNNECEKYGTCGIYGSCDRNTRPMCNCLTGFEPALPGDWNSGKWRGGCVRRTPLKCEKNYSTDGFLKLSGMKLPDDSHWQAIEMIANCEAMCTSNCSCAAFAHETGLGCLTWFGDLSDIQKFPDGGQNLYIRLAAAELGRKKKRQSPILILVTALGAMFLLAYSFFLWKWIRRERETKKKEHSQEMHLLDLSIRNNSNRRFQEADELEGSVKQKKSRDLPLFDLDTVRMATNEFSRVNKLGEGGFGPVYKGKLPNGQEIAVKRLSKGSGQGLVEFENEVILIAKLQHRNLVRLLGFCMQGEEKMLIYEYMPNRSLDSFIFDPIQGALLDWKKRFNVIEGIARGLLYLHRDSRLRIVHRDLKASNILLDEEMNPKISDFGMARIFGGNQNQANTLRVVGTYGYMAPEYAMEGLFSVKSDVFSFGVLLLEVVSSKRNTSFCQPDQPMNLLGHAWNLWKEDKMVELVDPSLRDSCSTSEVLRCIQVGLLCVQDSPGDRPTMDSVVVMLGSEATTPPTPKKPAFSVGRTPRETDLYPISSEICSVNDVTVSIIEEGR
ncbi:G-type lectin S-receptor-like serine/threonine-protein kinase B120 [Tasmannia lanceolata]|uniref:G-type lectin S-receptor-like serine/threonine-protein kinase B120 n=1 Tax=Tasmannia lanceolata TaxID=3420 RepID=UPI0040647517